METLTYTQFSHNFSAYFKEVVESDARYLVKRTKSSTFMFRGCEEGENLAGVRKITGSSTDMKKQMPRVFDAIAGNTGSKRAFVLEGQSAILECHQDMA